MLTGQENCWSMVKVIYDLKVSLSFSLNSLLHHNFSSVHSHHNNVSLLESFANSLKINEFWEVIMHRKQQPLDLSVQNYRDVFYVVVDGCRVFFGPGEELMV